MVMLRRFARGRNSCFAKTLPFLRLLHPVLLKPNGVDIDIASCIAIHQLAKTSKIGVWGK